MVIIQSIVIPIGWADTKKASRKNLLAGERGCILPLYLASTLGKKRIIQAEGAGYRNLFPSLTTQSMRFLHASWRAGAIFSHSCVAHTLFGSPNFTVRALPCEKIATSDAQR